VPRRALVIVNPAAGGGRTEDRWARLRERLGRTGFAFDWVSTAARGDATTQARRAVDAGVGLVVAVGGDGTLNEVLNGVVDDGGRARAALGLVPTGRGRDACRNLGVARDADAAVAALARDRERLVDVGVVEWSGGRRYFLNAAGAGFDAEVARRAQLHGGSGTIPYLLGVLSAVRRHVPAPATVKTDDGVWSGRTLCVVAANAPWYGGGMRIAPGALPTDGLLELVVLGDIRRLELLRWLPTLYPGTHLRNRKIRVHRCRTATVELAAAWPVHADGELVARTPVTFRVSPRAVTMRY
jgi:YegS/Rv2252/BmrU family lipid kinase